jgi:hypothetical protein
VEEGPYTPPLKRNYFLHYYLPKLRERLEERFITDTVAAAAGLEGDVANALLSEVLVADSPAQSAMAALQNIKEKPSPVSGSGWKWKGYLIPPADGPYAFVASAPDSMAPSKPPPELIIEGFQAPIAFTTQQPDPDNIWSTDPVPLKGGTLYLLTIRDRDVADLMWRTAALPATQIPASALLPDFRTAAAEKTAAEKVIIRVCKAAIIINGLNLSADEVRYFQTHGKKPDEDFGKFDLNLVTLDAWKRVAAYTSLRKSLPKAGAPLLNLFAWACQQDACHPDSTPLVENIAAVTQWKEDRIGSLIAENHFNPSAFKNEVNLVKMQKAIAVADKVGVDIERLFKWVSPSADLSDFWACHQTAQDIRMATHGRFDSTDWDQAVKPLDDQLREMQKQALISFLLVQQPLKDWGVEDADSLFEFFLIDVQMGAERQTSRMVQAIASVQLFIKRCLMGLEEPDVPTIAIDRPRWKWMQKYRVWEANRQVFLYPENWIREELRDDKSQFYKELESELLQKDINTQTVEDALKNYLYKVDEVANLKVVGLYLDQAGEKLHVFARTRHTPYFFYYRYFDYSNDAHYWYPWEKMQVDIPIYEDTTGDASTSGTYLIPIAQNGRLFIFFPQITKKTRPADIRSIQILIPDPQVGSKLIFFPPTPRELADLPPNAPQRDEYWEIQLAFSEYRNAKWTQKLVSTDACTDYIHNDVNGSPYPSGWSGSYRTLPDVSTYQFVPRAPTKLGFIVIEIYRNGQYIAAFNYASNRLELLSDHTLPPCLSFNKTKFHYVTPSNTLYSLQGDSSSSSLGNSPPWYLDKDTPVMHTVTGAPLFDFAWLNAAALNIDKLEDLFSYYLALYKTGMWWLIPCFGCSGQNAAHELCQPYSLYTWEVCFHAPMQLMEHLVDTQQFEQALAMCQCVFNPLATPGASEDVTKSCWRFGPFKDIDAKKVLENLFYSLSQQPPRPNQDINNWRDNPFEPHLIARARPSAYMKYVVMKYIDTLIQYGDYYFRQNTMESIPMAIQCYVMASHLYGQRGQKIPPLGKIETQTYNSLLDKWDAFGNAMVELELAFPFSNQTSVNASNAGIGFPNVFGSMSRLYFGIPNNPNLTALGGKIDDRLLKIRSCENIEGIFQQVPLFEPAIDPALLVQAAAQGLSLSSILSDMNSPMPNYRFYYLLQKALELCGELKALGNAFLSAKEKGDAEALSNMRATHESNIQNLVIEVKKQQLEEANKSLQSLLQNRKGPVSRMQYYLKLIGEDLSKVPDESTDFSELPNQLEQPVDESGLKLIHYEKEEMDKAGEAAALHVAIGVRETLAGILHALPSVTVDAKPWGIGVGTVWGSPNLANATQSVATSMRVFADYLSHQSTSAARKGGFLRQLQDRIQQANAAGYEIKNIDKQILIQEIRQAISNKEIDNQQKQMDNAKKVEDFLRNKYTNAELYSWMEGNIRTLYYQAYTLAYDLAKKAEKAYRFERPAEADSNFIQFGYWDAGRDGLLAGERLYLALKQLERAYQEKRGYDFEITKHVSLRQLNPLALIQLRETGSCEFELPEVLFDRDYPGHYMRRIKSVALTIPCVVGPYTSLSCTLRLLEHTFRTSSVCGRGGYARQMDQPDSPFSTLNVPISAIAASTGQNDSGVFELNFRDERYIPFEGAGAVSKWRVTLPEEEELRQFDYKTISDVVMHLRYTAIDGGDKLKVAAIDSVKAFNKYFDELSQQEGLFAFFDLKHDFPAEWSTFVNGSADFAAVIRKDYFPYFAQRRKIDNIKFVLYGGQGVSTPQEVGDPDQAKTALSETAGQYTLTWPNKVLAGVANSEVFLIIHYSLGSATNDASIPR